MKYIIIVPDGMPDLPLPELNSKTPLEVANKPNMDYLAKNGIVGIVRNIPLGCEAGSDVAILSVLGYEPDKCYTGRGPLEAASMNIELAKNEVAFRVNLVTVKDDIMIDYSAGHISTSEAKILMKLLDEKFGNEKLKFYPGISYRNLLVSSILSPAVRCTPPHDILGKQIKEYMPKGETQKIIIRFMEDSRLILSGHEINRERRASNKNPANMIWIWGGGKSPQIETFKERFDITGGAISAVDVVKGIAKYAGLDVINVPGATGYYDTDYKAKGEYALKILSKRDFCLVHIEATDEASHNGDINEKIKAIEQIDEKILGQLLNYLKDKDYKIMVLPDHQTLISTRTHDSGYVPFVMCGKMGLSLKGQSPTTSYNEISAEKSGLKFERGKDLFEFFIGYQAKVENGAEGEI